MPTITTADGVELHFSDTGGDARPIVLIHGWPLSGQAFARNIPAFEAAGYRVVTYDRRGFGQSSAPTGPIDYDVLAGDLATVLDTLDLKDAVLVGFSMGGGEVARYLGSHGSERVSAAVFSGSITPALCITDDNPDGGMPFDGFQGMIDAHAEDRDGFLEQFVGWFYSTESGGLQVDEQTVAAGLAIAKQSDPTAAGEAIGLWATDLRDDCREIDVPTLVIHGDGDINVPLAKSSARMSEFVKDCTHDVIEGGPHGVNDSQPERWQNSILDFVRGVETQTR